MKITGNDPTTGVATDLSVVGGKAIVERRSESEIAASEGLLFTVALSNTPTAAADFFGFLGNKVGSIYDIRALTLRLRCAAVEVVTVDWGAYSDNTASATTPVTPVSHKTELISLPTISAETDPDILTIVEDKVIDRIRIDTANKDVLADINLLVTPGFAMRLSAATGGNAVVAILTFRLERR